MNNDTHEIAWLKAWALVNPEISREVRITEPTGQLTPEQRLRAAYTGEKTPPMPQPKNKLLTPEERLSRAYASENRQ
jgi:hypothetical protein